MPHFPISKVGEPVLLSVPARHKFPKNGKRDYIHHQLALVTECNDAGLVLTADYKEGGKLPHVITDKDRVGILLFNDKKKKHVWNTFAGKVFMSEVDFMNQVKALLNE